MKNKISLGSVVRGSEAFHIGEEFINTKKSLLYIARDDKEIFNLYYKLKWLFPQVDILIYRSWDQIPYDNVSPSKEIQSERIKTLYSILYHKSKKIIITSVNAIIQKTINKNFLKKSFIEVSRGKEIKFNNLIQNLIALGYERNSVVRDKTEFAVRGSIIDIFIIENNYPIRIDFFGDKIESIYYFDPATQKRTKISEEIFFIHTSSELLLTNESLASFRKNFREIFNSYRSSQIYHSFSEGIIPSGGEQFLPLFIDKMDSIFNFLESTKIILNNDFQNLLELREENINDFYNARKNLKDNFFLEPNNLFISKKEILLHLDGFDLIRFEEFNTEKNINSHIKKIPNLSSLRKEIDFNFIKHFFNTNEVLKKIIVCCRTEGSLQRVSKILLDNINIKFTFINNFNQITNDKNYFITVLDNEDSFNLNKFIFINEKTIFGYNFATKKTNNKNKEIFLEEMNKLKRGNILVHSEYGLCRFLDINKININDSFHDCVELEFADNQKLFLPVENLNNITKYGNDEEKSSPLDRLGASHWQKRKAEAKKRIKEAAKKLIATAAIRLKSKSYKINFNQSDYEKFSSTFPYIETDDQLSAINDVINDFNKNIPSDRLIVGDVAFGKTEVIIRAIYLASKSNLQSIVLVPTTLLAKQHYENFSKRFETFGINVSQISRFTSNKKKLLIYDEIKNGKSQIIVGTHALLNDKIIFNKLGLIVYDEEQKLGTQQKEKLKEIAPNAHVISLSATPIPRTLSLSLSGIRDLSLILTAPYERLSIRTFVSPFDEFTISEAIKREVFGRKNGVYFVTPRKKDIPFLEKFMNEKLPSIKYVVAHGKLAPNILEDRISKFYNQEVPLMISTNIIENGLDLPNVNTIIIYRSNIFSLSGLYQLKGRVGRSTKRGYAYLTYNEKEMTENGRKRLNIINSFNELGSGFNIASQDLDIRGGGSIIGEEQSGFIKEIGTELYHQMLEEEIIRQKQKITNKQDLSYKFSFQPTIKIPEEIYIPENYIDDLDLRMSIYKRISSIDSLNESNNLMIELIDRFGNLPKEIENLFKLMEVKILCLNCNIELLEFSRKGVVIGFYKNQPLNPEKVMKLGFSNKDQISIRHDQKIFYDFYGELSEDRFSLAKRIIKIIS